MNVEVTIDSSKVFASLDDFKGLINKIAEAINETHTTALKYEKLGLSCGKHYREAMELFGSNIEKLLAEYAPESN